MPFVDLGDDAAVIQVSAGGGSHTCALFEHGRIKCWGANYDQAYQPPPGADFGGTPPSPLPPENFGRLGYEDREDRVAPFGDNLPYVDLGTEVRAVAVLCSSARTCAVIDDGRLKCWGANLAGPLLHGMRISGDGADLGDEPGEMGDALPYVDLGSDRKVRALATGWRNFAWLDDGNIVEWPGPDGEMGDALAPVLTAEHLGLDVQ